MKGKIDEVKVNEIFDEAKKDLIGAEEHKKNTIVKLASDLEALGMEKRKISSEINKRLVKTGFVSSSYARECLNPEQKDESKANIIPKPKVRESNAPLVAHTTTGHTQTVQESNPNPTPEPTIDESKAPDQGIIGNDEDLPEGKEYYDTEKEDLKKNIAGYKGIIERLQDQIEGYKFKEKEANAKILELSQPARERDDRDIAIETLQQDNGKLRTELAQARLDNVNEPTTQKQEGSIVVRRNEPIFQKLTIGVNKMGNRELDGIILDYSGEKVTVIRAIKSKI